MKKKAEIKVAKKVKKSKEPKKSSIGKWISLGTMLLGIVLVVVGIFVSSIEIAFKLLGMLFILGSGFALIIRSDKHVFVKSIIWVTFIAIVLTWLFSYGSLQGASYAKYGFNRVGFNDIPTVLYYMVYFALDKMLFLAAVAGFYGVLSITKGYRKLVTDCAKKMEPYKYVIAVIVMVAIFLLASILSNSLILVLFIPFILSVYSKMKVDKFTAFLTTFGAILIGSIGAPWGTDSLTWFNYYVGTTLNDGFTLRLIVEACALVLTLVFILLRVRKLKKGKNVPEAVEDVFEVEEYKERSGKVFIIIVMAVLAVIMLLGYINWESNFNIKVFADFHKWLTELTVGDNTVIAYVLGQSAKALGTFDIATFITILLIASAVIGLANRIKINDFLTAFGNGIKKMAKPIALFVCVFAVFVVMYMTPVIPGITMYVSELTKSFNPYLTSAMAFITSIFHADLGYTGYAVGGLLTGGYADNLSIAHTLYFTMHGLAQLIIPIGGLLVLGLATTKVSYKTWLKYIWRFALILLVVILIIATIVVYL